MDPKRKFFLFKQAEHFCSVPWNYVKVNMDGSISTCVNGKTNLGNINDNTITEILSNPNLTEIRANLSTDVLDKNCVSCHGYNNINDSYEYKFLRELYNPMFKDVDIDYNNTNSFKLSGIDLHWSSVCDLKCITCWSRQSSSIAIEEGKEVLHTPSEQADKLIDYIVENQSGLKEIYLSGGEPTLIKHNLHLLKRLRKDQNFIIRINTNMMFDDNNLIIKELLEFPNVLVTMSADSMGDRFNYIRRGANWNYFVKNVDKLFKTHFSLRLNSVFFVGSVLHLADTQKFFIDNYNISDFTINQLYMGDPVLACRNLKEDLKNICREKLLEHKNNYKNNKNLVGQLTNCITELDQQGTPAYKSYFESIDAKAGTNWKQTFPELAYE